VFKTHPYTCVETKDKEKVKEKGKISLNPSDSAQRLIETLLEGRGQERR
jgi:hypothetical protein